jgi:alkanesulfonate monooxygenase SsuD/methylene tetrahydromethanopterin reductase-like flavin-dependent oxidoreductase (luciferase family)
MRFSVWPINQQPYDDALAVARHAEATGWDGIWMSDHLIPSGPPLDRPVLECWTTVAALLAKVPRVRIGTLVSSNTFREPALVAKMASNLGDISGGRFVLGIGAGWQENEHAAYGIALPPPAERLARLDEACVVIRRLLHEDSVTFDGRYYELAQASVAPRVPVPLLVGVKGPRAIRIAARHADEWNLWGLPETVREKSLQLELACDELGRDPSKIRRSAQALLCMTGPDGAADADRWRATKLPMLTGGAAELTDVLGAYVEAGIDELIIPDFTLGETAAKLDLLDQFIEDVALDFRDIARPIIPPQELRS